MTIDPVGGASVPRADIPDRTEIAPTASTPPPAPATPAQPSIESASLSSFVPSPRVIALARTLGVEPGMLLDALGTIDVSSVLPARPGGYAASGTAADSGGADVDEYA